MARCGLACVGLCLPFGAGAAAMRDEGEIQRWISQHAQRVRGIEVPNTRQRVSGDLDGDKRADVAVLYTLKPRGARGGESRYLAAFKRQRDGLRYHAHVLVIGPGAGEANRITILNQAVVVEMLTFAPNDASCCPTRPAIRRYRVSPRGLALAATDAPRPKH